MSNQEPIPAAEVTGTFDSLETQAHYRRLYESFHAFVTDQETKDAMEPAFWIEARDSIIREITRTSKKLHALKKGLGRVVLDNPHLQK